MDALLMRANKPETAVQSSEPFSPGTTWIIHHVDVLAGYGCLLASLLRPNPPRQLLECGFWLVFWSLTSRSGEGP